MKPAGVIIALTLLPGSAWADDKHPKPPWLDNPPIVTVKKELYRKSPRPGAAALAAVYYVGPNLERMEWRGVEVNDDVHDEQVARWSTDNGRSWSEYRPLRPSSNVTYKGVTVWEGSGCKLFDSAAGVLVETWLRQIAHKGLFHNFTYYRLSRHVGKTWSAPKQLRYESGKDFDPNDPLKPGFRTKNEAYFGSNIVRHTKGTLIHCVGHANAPGDADNAARPWKMGSLCFIGKWDATTKDYQWTAGRRVEVSPEVSSRSLIEPEVAELHDGRVLVVWRGSDTAKTPAASGTVSRPTADTR